MAAQKKFGPHNPSFTVDEYPYLSCREQHPWVHYDGSIDEKTRMGYRVQKCPNCEMKKHTTINLNPRSRDYGRRITRYRPPTDYRIPGGLDSYDRGLIVIQNFMAELGGDRDDGQEP